ncbi:protein grc3, variant 4 [Blastomyces gilchristii SLH14081]|uniref:Polynucleotide 5'-hydroxyl-kinase GRC3 n=1 Tax=Blastomyces gilchristii (strain SLH14081) TaxID=559298 RepID=A0A179U919_BLAGS|nr:protein grc3 [Blastomyces gilchristii SLH14081]XP_031575811.1 protein grc3, variant 1 [Blastomyces gilchristii SLH14081]XP_031575812.1 protein grc3, variant 2 [Blastomyces gilchristii SLH14081]XP_031575813.1 protein grc3, variant 3 [Blastomyces gilchristii SLH14081]XP_031575814.1 protein grc3, variant 4 [Blastomyces gilchristii SLH14081]OAT03785.1 protein grc3 [Blastomyces gilchristii SLH14081]OAT03786.1 protein grc3, variant 1 [Blastomyces gilchristii SLH14081]OAT03787.1 protein grc3, va
MQSSIKASGASRSARTTAKVLRRTCNKPELRSKNPQARPLTLAKLDFAFKMKRKGDMQSQSAPVSAIAARRSRLAAASQASTTDVELILNEEPPLKKTKTSSSKRSSRDNSEKRQSPRQEGDTEAKVDLSRVVISKGKNSNEPLAQDSIEEYQSDVGDDNDGVETDVTSDDEESDGPLANAPADFQNFLLSKSRIGSRNVVYRTDNAICIRLKLKMNVALIGQYDLWVKRGVVSIMGAKLHPSPRLYRVYAPSTHSLPVIKCVSGVEDYAEVEIRSYNNGLFRLRNLSNLYHRIWNSNEPAPGSILQAGGLSSFSILHSSSDDPLKRHLRPLHLEKKWSMSIQMLSQRGGALRVLTCGPKGSGKSTFNKYLLNHLLSPPPLEGNLQHDQHGVAFLDLDPGQPELSPMGQIYLAHLRTPLLGPPFSHPTIDSQSNGCIVRSHYIGASSPKDDPDHYITATMDLMSRYHELLQSYPQLPLIINYPGWIFGLGLEIAISLVSSLGLTDVVYMSDKGPAEVVEPLTAAALEAGISVTILPSQPTDFVTRSSAQLRSMQMLSYFHSNQYQGSDRTWTDTPLCRTRPVTVKYSGASQGIFGIMVTGSRHDPDMLRDLLDGAVVGVVAIENLNAISSVNDEDAWNCDSLDDRSDKSIGASRFDPDGDVQMDPDVPGNENQSPSSPLSSSHASHNDDQHPSITRTARENLPCLFVGSGACTPLDPNLSHCLGQAIIRSVNPETQTLDIYTPIPLSKIRETLEQGNRLILVRGQVDNPNWAISEECFSARAAQRRHRKMIAQAKAAGITPDARARRQQDIVSERLRERVMRVGNVPWMRLDEGSGDTQEHGSKQMWRLRKKAYPADSGSGSDREW